MILTDKAGNETTPQPFLVPAKAEADAVAGARVRSGAANKEADAREKAVAAAKEEMKKAAIARQEARRERAKAAEERDAAEKAAQKARKGLPQPQEQPLDPTVLEPNPPWNTDPQQQAQALAEEVWVKDWATKEKQAREAVEAKVLADAESKIKEQEAAQMEKIKEQAEDFGIKVQDFRATFSEEAPFAFVDQKDACCKLQRRFSRAGDLEAAAAVKHGHAMGEFEA